MTELERPKVGVAVFIVRDGMTLLGKRKGSHGAGEYAPPGGSLEYKETIEECSFREVDEEVGSALKIKNLGLLCVTDQMKYSEHFVNIGMVAEYESGEAQLMEPDKCEGWDWYPIDNLPQPLFACVANFVIAYQTGQRYFTKA